MATIGTNNSNSGNSKPILTGNTILDKLLNQLSKDDREFILRLMAELGIPTNDPMHPFLVALQYYVHILREIPAAMKSSADESFRKAVTVYGTIQTNIDNSTKKIETEVGKIDSIRVQWGNDVKALLPEFRTAFDEAMKTATAAYQKKINKIAETSLQDWGRELESTRTIYLRDVFQQGLIWAGSSTAIALLSVGGAAYWVGTQHGRDAAVQASYKAFGRQPSYDFAKELMNREDNVQRFIKCQDEGNEKCTVWIKNPPQQ